MPMFYRHEHKHSQQSGLQDTDTANFAHAKTTEHVRALLNSSNMDEWNDVDEIVGASGTKRCRKRICDTMVRIAYGSPTVYSSVLSNSPQDKKRKQRQARKHFISYNYTREYPGPTTSSHIFALQAVRNCLRNSQSHRLRCLFKLPILLIIFTLKR